MTHENSITYTVWPVHQTDEWESLTRQEAQERYGQTTIDAMETVILLNPGQTVALKNKQEELLVEYAHVKREAATYGISTMRLNELSNIADEYLGEGEEL